MLSVKRIHRVWQVRTMAPTDNVCDTLVYEAVMQITRKNLETAVLS